MEKRAKMLSGTLKSMLVLLLLAFLLMPARTEARSRPQPEFDNNAWVASWDYEAGLKEARAVSSQLNSVSYFGAALDRQGRVIVLGKAREFVREPLPRYRTEIRRYLSVVNDVYDNVDDPAARTRLKDTEVLETLLASPETRKQHIAELFRAMKDYGYTGLEIDYERVWRQPRTALLYVKFIQELAAAAEAEQIPLRIILEPSTPANKLVLPEGPEYVMMCYNLYGTHTADGGPKADKAFIDTVLARLDRLPRPHSIAFATGGCVWETGKRPRFVTEKEALRLQRQLQAEPRRDDASGALSFTGHTKTGTLSCWYADAETLNQWKHQALQHGVDGISLWRLGQNEHIAEYYPGMVNNKER